MTRTTWTVSATLARASALALAFPLIALAASPATFDEVRRDAQSLYRSGQYPEARSRYQQMADMNPSDPAVLKEAMWAYWNMQFFEEAEKAAHRVLEKTPDDAEAKNILSWIPRAATRDKVAALRETAVTYYRSGRSGAAADAYGKIVELQPGNVSVLKDWMWSLWTANRFEEAQRAAQRVLKLQPQDATALDIVSRAPEAALRSELGTLQGTEGEDRKAKALALYERLARSRPQDASLQRALAWSYYSYGRIEEARRSVERALALSPHETLNWNLAGKIYLEQGLLDKATAAYSKSLSLDPQQPDVQVGMGKLQMNDRNFEEALRAFERARSVRGDYAPAVLPLVAKAQFYTGHYADSAKTWQQAVKAFPDDLAHQYDAANALFHAGEHEEALREMRRLYEEKSFTPAAIYLVDYYIAIGDSTQAASILEKTTQEITAESESRAIRLMGLYFRNGPRNYLKKVLDRFLKARPDHIGARLLLGHWHYDRQEFEEAREIYLEVLQKNPYIWEAVANLSQCDLALDRPDEARQAIQRLIDFDPTYPQYALLYASYLEQTEDSSVARQYLKDWLGRFGQGPALPIVLYHGLTSGNADPLLAYSYHHSTGTYENQLIALKEAGYRSVTIEDVDKWLDGQRDLPQKPILIAFDDARVESFRFGDEGLRKAGFTATMFVPIVNVEGRAAAGYASWKEINAWKATGRWDIQAHGLNAHVRDATDEAGHKDLFLVNRFWLPSEKRMETREEWLARIEKDYADNITAQERAVGIKPIAYAYPEGVYGQSGNANVSDAARVNRALVEKYYRMAFVQDMFGMNLPSRTRSLMRRLEPDNRWTGKQLVDHLRDNNPLNLMYARLLQWSLSDGRTREAFRWLAKLKSNDATDAVVESYEAQIRLAAGDFAEGQTLAKRALMRENATEVQNSIQGYLVEQKNGLIPYVSWEHDSNHRERLSGGARYELARTHGDMKWFGTYSYARASEPGVPTIRTHSAGIGMDASPLIFHRVEGQVNVYDSSSPGMMVVGGNASWEAQWSDAFSTEFVGSRYPYPTARALASHIVSNQGDLQLRWNNEGPWHLLVRERMRFLTDRNRRSTSQVQISRQLLKKTNLRLAYRFTYDDSLYASPAYYAPKNLVENAVGPQWAGVWNKRIQWALNYWPSYGHELGRSSAFSHSVEAELGFRLAETVWFKPNYLLYDTPSYREHTAGAEVTIRF